jgi:anti-sigma factor RsiW
MHIRSAALVAFCDAETGASRSRRIAAHLAKCERCRDRLRRIEREKEELSAGAVAPAIDSPQGLAGVRSAMATWQDGQSWATAALKNRLRWQLETYFGFPALLAVDRRGIRTEELLGRTSEMLDVFLGPDAAEAVRDDCLSGLSFAGPAEEMRL